MKNQLSMLVMVVCLSGLSGCTYLKRWIMPAPEAALATAIAAPALTANTLVASAKPAPKPVNMTLLKQGYVAEQFRGEYIYCRLQDQTGSRLRAKVCNTEAKLLEQESDARAFLEAARQQRVPRCSMMNCGRR